MTDWKEIRDWTRTHVQPMSKTDWGKVAIPANCTEETWKQTFAVCVEAAKRGYLFATEVKMKNGRRADVIIPEANIVVEIHDSEDKNSLDLKQEDYGNIMVRLGVHEDPKTIFGR